MKQRLPLFPPRHACLLLLVVLAGLLALQPACTRQAAAGVAEQQAQSQLNQPHNASVNCRQCHQELYAKWYDSHHAKAHRPIVPEFDAQYVRQDQTFTEQGVRYTMGFEQGQLKVVESQQGHPDFSYSPAFVLGHTPLRQLIVPTGNGHFQAASLALDPARNEWFEVFGNEGRKPGEWGHWRGRGMNWNSMCAHCHMTAFDRGYDLLKDSYSSTWLEHGVGCVQCHGSVSKEHLQEGYKTRHRAVPPMHTSPVRMMETCAPCHARNELLTGKLVPGAHYADQHRLVLPVDRGVFYADGQQRDEDFNYTSFLLSRMGGKAGVTCHDCHDPHTLKTRLPSTNNALCMQCHASPGRQGAPVIEPTRHSGHKEDSTGNQCVACHMPTTPYMQRDPRHDHGFIIPDPLLTKELGIPNACTRCHQDKTLDWEIESMRRIYGDQEKQGHKRQRTRAVEAAYQGRGDTEQLLKLLKEEPIPAWRATLLTLAGRSATAPSDSLRQAAKQASAAPDPMERSAAAQLLANHPEEQATLHSLLADPTLLVRLDAGLALGDRLPKSTTVMAEVEEYTKAHADQPLGRARLAQHHFLRNEPEQALAELRRATEWDPNSPDLWNLLSQLQHASGKPREAAESLGRVATLLPDQAEPCFSSALLWAEAGELGKCEAALLETLRREPTRHRAWYNLGLIQQGSGRRSEALKSLEKAERLDPREPDYPYALAVLHLQSGAPNEAKAAAKRALQLNPRHQAAELRIP